MKLVCNNKLCQQTFFLPYIYTGLGQVGLAWFDARTSYDKLLSCCIIAQT